MSLSLIAAGPLGKSGHFLGLQLVWRVSTRAVDQGSADCAISRSLLGRGRFVFSTLVCHMRFWEKKGLCGQKKSLNSSGLPCPIGAVPVLQKQALAVVLCKIRVETCGWRSFGPAGPIGGASLIISVHVTDLSFQESSLPFFPLSSHPSSITPHLCPHRAALEMLASIFFFFTLTNSFQDFISGTAFPTR